MLAKQAGATARVVVSCALPHACLARGLGGRWREVARCGSVGGATKLSRLTGGSEQHAWLLSRVGPDRSRCRRRGARAHPQAGAGPGVQPARRWPALRTARSWPGPAAAPAHTLAAIAGGAAHHAAGSRPAGARWWCRRPRQPPPAPRASPTAVPRPASRRAHAHTTRSGSERHSSSAVGAAAAAYRTGQHARASPPQAPRAAAPARGGPQAAAQPAMASTTRAAARRQAAEQRNAAAWPLPLEVLPLVAAHLARETWAAARLSCKQLEAALAPHVRSLSLARPGGRGRQLRLRPGLVCVATLEVPGPASDAEWNVLQQLTAQLPALRHLRISRGEDDEDSFSFSLPAPVAASWAGSSLTWLELPDSDQHVLPAVSLPGLRVARLGSRSRVSAGAVAAFAPRLQQLACGVLELDAAQPPGAVLEALTHLHAACVEVTGAGSVADGVAALRHALPAVAVLVWELDVRDPSWTWRASLDDVLAVLPGVTAVRSVVASSSLPGVRASSLGRLQHLVVYRVAQDTQQLLPAVPHMQRLASFTLVCAPGDSMAPLLRALAALPALASLVLPVRALCETCCPGVHAALPALVGSTSLVSLEFVACDRSWLNCEHAGSCTAGESAVRVAAAQRGAPLQRLSLQHEVRVSRRAAPDFMRQAARGEGGVWGAYGPVEGQV